LIQSNTLSDSWFKAIPCQPVDLMQYLVRQLIQSNICQKVDLKQYLVSQLIQSNTLSAS